jgi:cell division protease FtsH
MIISVEERRNTAYHESGHALVAKLTPGSDPVHKVTIIPRGMALGVTQQLPLDERHTWSSKYITNRIRMLLGGRAAEELILGETTTGAGDDLQKATDLARRMVCEWGMSETLGPVTLGRKDEEIFLGRDFGQVTDYSDNTAVEIDTEVRNILKSSYDKARKLLEDNVELLHKMAELLLERESLDSSAIEELIREHNAAGGGGPLTAAGADSSA